MKVAVGCDHGGFVLKDAVVQTLKELGAQVEDMGTFSEESVDYPRTQKKLRTQWQAESVTPAC